MQMPRAHVAILWVLAVSPACGVFIAAILLTMSFLLFTQRAPAEWIVYYAIHFGGGAGLLGGLITAWPLREASLRDRVLYTVSFSVLGGCALMLPLAMFGVLIGGILGCITATVLLATRSA